jgi:hypothetical protein
MGELMKIMVCLALTALCGSVFAQGTVARQGYFNKYGTYVAPSYATAPNSTKLDNYSTKGNYNPYTGKMGTVNPYRIEPYSAPDYTVKPLAPLRTYKTPYSN